MVLHLFGSPQPPYPLSIAIFNIFNCLYKVGDFFNEGIYDMHIHVKHIPLLPWEAPDIVRWSLTAADIMTRDVISVRTVNQVRAAAPYPQGLH